jgi:hypothetical protein
LDGVIVAIEVARNVVIVRRSVVAGAWRDAGSIIVNADE